MEMVMDETMDFEGNKDSQKSDNLLNARSLAALPLGIFDETVDNCQCGGMGQNGTLCTVISIE